MCACIYERLRLYCVKNDAVDLHFLMDCVKKPYNSNLSLSKMLMRAFNCICAHSTD